jgi:general secretion pathway protein N
MALELDQNVMLDLRLTQRLLLNISSYNGKAGLDTYVVSSRQPLFKGGL